MKHLYPQSFISILKTFLLVFLVFNSNDLFADGSRDLYPVGVQGYRAKLRAYNVENNSYPYANNGVHYVYAKVGEQITMASSAQNVANPSSVLVSRIKLYNPSGAEIINNGIDGRIPNRTEELAGPALPGGAVGHQYVPIYHTVSVEGIYRVEFTAPHTLETLAYVNADENFIQGNNVNVIFAWDVSVVNTAGSAFIPGRVYTNVMTMSTGGSSGHPTIAYYGVLYALTKDGYTYKVNNNGNQGFGFTFFVNNNGVLDVQTKQPIYKSLAGISQTANASRIHNPNEPDTETQITHKLFYTLPANDLPTDITTGAVPGGATWLKTTRTLPTPTAITIEGVEGTPEQLSRKGGYIKFNSPVEANYSISIVNAGSSTFATRVLTGTAKAGANKIYFDGKDGNGHALPAGAISSTVQIQLQGAEVHFPYIDMEYNKNGVIIERLDGPNLSTVVSDLVYWDDSDIPTAANPAGAEPYRRRSEPKVNTHINAPNNTGISSNTNGHIWAQDATAFLNTFGDSNVMDTWTFVKGRVVSETLTFKMAEADLKISQFSASPAIVLPGDVATFTVKAKNDGPDAANGAGVSIKVPSGFTASAATFNGNNCGSETTAINYNTANRTYNAVLNLPNGCEVTYVFSATASAQVNTATPAFVAAVLRPKDMTDPDATATDPGQLPTDPQYECDNSPGNTSCNNIRTIALSFAQTAPCTEQVLGETFSVSGGVSQSFTMPGTDYGFQFDIYKLDNSFNMTINGVQLATSEIEFQSNQTPPPGINIRFADGSKYEVNTQEIWRMTGTAAAPLIRLVISPIGLVNMYGSKVSGGQLFPLELFNGNSFNTISWNTTTSNTVVITQNVVDVTNMTGRGYGLKLVPCICFNPANTSGPGVDSKLGITLLQRAGKGESNWPLVRKSGHLVLESNTKGFVITRVAKANLGGIANPQPGMMVYDTTDECLKIYDDGAWACFSTPGCP